MIKEMTDKREGAQPAKTNWVVKKTEHEDRRIQDALEDDEVREALEQLHAGKNGLACDYLRSGHALLGLTDDRHRTQDA
jgi:hypothetical protein